MTAGDTANRGAASSPSCSGFIRRLSLGLALAGLAAVAACNDSDAPGCRIAQITTLPVTPLTALADVRLERVGADLVLFGTDPGRNNLRSARISADGTLQPELATTVPARVLGPVFAATRKNAPGDQLVAVYGVARGPTSTALHFTVVGPDATGSRGALLDPAGAEILLEGDPANFQLAMGSTRSGAQAILAWGNRTLNAGPQLLLVKADGATAGAPVSIGAAGAPWDCLQIVPGRSDFGLQRMIRAADDKPSWSFVDFREDGSASYTLTVQAPHAEIGCPLVTPTTNGYAFAWQNREGSYFSDIDTTRPQPLVTTDIARAAVHFGGPGDQPPLSSIASMGRDFALVYGAPAGPLVHRFDVFGVPRGAYTYLPSRGRTSPAVAWPEPGAVFVTYFDQGAAPAADQRQLVKVDCPADSP